MATEDDNWPYDVTEVGSEPPVMAQGAPSEAVSDDNPQDGQSGGVGDSDALERVWVDLIEAALGEALEEHGIAVDDEDWQHTANAFSIGYATGGRDASLAIAAKSPAGVTTDVSITKGDMRAHAVAYVLRNVVVIAAFGEQFPISVWERAGWTVKPGAA